MEQIQKATLTLKSTHLSIGTPDFRGVVKTFSTHMTWNNINLRLLLGDMYDKYDNFNLKLAFIAADDDRLSTDVFPAGDTRADRIVTINLSGLNFINNTYDSYTNNNSSSVVIATWAFYETFSKEFNNSIVTFTKGNDMCNLTIEYKDVGTDTTPSTINAFPEMVFVFHIYGIPRDTKKH